MNAIPESSFILFLKFIPDLVRKQVDYLPGLVRKKAEFT